jgi:hypothetical protein
VIDLSGSFTQITMAVFDRILGDILDFIRRYLWSQADSSSVKPKPFEAIQKPIQGSNGVIRLVIGRDTPRATRTWIFSPYNLVNQSLTHVLYPLDDIHIYLDFLGPLPNAPETKKTYWELSQRKAKEKGEEFLTHRIQILRASHMLNAHGFYDYELLFWKDYDFYRQGLGAAERWAIAAVDRVAHRLLVDPNMNWEKDIEEIRQVVLGAYQSRTVKGTSG